MTAHSSIIQDMDAICITLLGEQRSDGSIFVRSPDLPVFSAVGSSEQDALENAMAMLVPYLEANVPDYVDLKRLTGAPKSLGEETDSILPAHIIAFRGGGHDGHTTG